jgi:hypothetical protein
MKKYILNLMITAFLCSSATAQVRHTASMDYNFYANIFTATHISPTDKGNFAFAAPQLNYTLFYKKHSLNLGVSMLGRIYNSVSYKTSNDNIIKEYGNHSYYLLYGYSMISTKRIELILQAGINYGKYYYYKEPSYYETCFVESGEPWAMGFSIGINPRVNIWKGLYLNPNVKYTYNPFVREKSIAQNIIMSLGIGYTFGGKK